MQNSNLNSGSSILISAQNSTNSFQKSYQSKKLRFFQANATNQSSEIPGMINAFSTVPKVAAPGHIEVYENAVFFHHPLQPSHYSVAPERSENDIKKFSSKSRKHLFNIFNTLQYSSYGLPCFISATWHYDSPDNRKQLKNFLEKFVKRLKRNLPPFHAIWKLEYQKRGVPHFHFILLPLDRKQNMFTQVNDNAIKTAWLDLKQCKCTHCKFFSIKTVSVLNYKMAISYISKEIAKVQDRYEDHDMGRIWGTSQNLRCAPIFNLSCDINTFHKIIDRKLEEMDKTKDSYWFVNGLRFLEQNTTVFISSTKILDLINSLHKKENDFNSFFTKYKLKHSNYLKVQS